MIIFISIILLLITAIIITALLLYFKAEKENKTKTIGSIEDILDAKAFYPTETYFINKHLTIAINKHYTKLAVIKNFNPNNPTYFDYFELALSFIIKIEQKGSTIKLYYSKQGEAGVIDIYPAPKEIKDFIHRIYKNACLKKIENKFPNTNFSLTSSSNFECDYVWAYCPSRSEFAYYKTIDKPYIYKINLRKEFFTLDIKYGYCELPICGRASQIQVYENDFLHQLFEYLLDEIKEKVVQINENTLFYDNIADTLYLSNGINSLQSVLLNEVEEVFYKENKIMFSLNNDGGYVNFISNVQLIKEFEEFVINYNLKKIAQNFNYKSDKLINTTQYTKFIFDFSRDRTIYCANLNKFKSFSYMTIAFNNISDAEIKTNNFKHFVRIFTEDGDILDVSCDKKEVAYYIHAQIKKINNSR